MVDEDGPPYPPLLVWLNETVAPLLSWLLSDVTVAVRVTEWPDDRVPLSVRLVTELAMGSSNGLAHAWALLAFSTYTTPLAGRLAVPLIGQLLALEATLLVSVVVPFEVVTGVSGLTTVI